MDQAAPLENENRPVDEALEAFASLSDPERRNLAKVAEIFAGRGNLASAHELINEAYVRMAEGERNWSRKDSFPVFFAGIVRSLATDKQFQTDSQKVSRLKGGYSVVGQDDLPSVMDGGDDGMVAQKVMVERMYAHMEERFAKDDEMLLLVLGIQEGQRGKQLADTIGVDSKRLEALRTRFSRELKSFIAARCAEEGQSNG